MAFFFIDEAGKTHGQAVFSAGVPGGARAGWKWDGAKLEVESRPHGFYPLYLLREPETFGVATSLLELLPFAKCRAVDESAMAAFLRLGFFLGDDTPLAVIRANPSVETFTWEAGQLRLGESFQQPDRSNLNREQLKSEYEARFLETLEATKPEHEVLVPLTGGRDSRHILFGLMRLGRPPAQCITALHYPPNSDDDIRIAATVSSRLGLRHRILPLLEDRFSAERRKNQLTSFCSDEHAWALPLIESLPKRMSLFDGIGGDILSAGLYLTERQVSLYEHRNIQTLADELLGDPRLSDLMFRRTAAKAFSYDRARARLEAELAKFAHLHNPLTQFYFWNRTRREISLYTFSMVGRHHDVYTPYIQPELLNFLLSIPTAHTVGKKLHTEVILENYPQWADIPFEDKDKRKRRTNVWYAITYSSQVALQAAKGTVAGPKAVAPLLATIITGRRGYRQTTNLLLVEQMLAHTEGYLPSISKAN